MISDPQVTVLIPNYNHEAFLRKRINSVIHQSYCNLEVYILDDYSNDNSIKIINEYKNFQSFQGVFVNERNSGSVFKQWEKGINLTRGKYLWIAESDDYADPDFLKEMVALAEKNPSAGLVFSDSYNVDAKDLVSGKVSSKHPLLNKIQELYQKFSKGDEAALYFISDMLILNASSVLFNTEKLKSVVDFEELQAYKNCGDRFVYLSIYLNFDIVYLDKPLNYRRNHENNITKTNFSSGLIFKERIIIINYFFNKLKDRPEAEKAFNKYLKNNFLPLVDHGVDYEIIKLIRKFYLSGLISLKKFIYLSLFIFVSKCFKNYTPYILRQKVKEVLKFHKNNN